MTEVEGKKVSRVSKGTAALAALACTVGLGWTLSSGLKSPPKTVITSSNTVSLAVPYRGMCGDLEVKNQDGTLDLHSQDVRSGLAKLSFELPAGEHDLTLHFHGVIPGLEREYPLQVTVDQTPPLLTSQLESAPAPGAKVLTQTESLKLTGSTEPGTQVFLEGESLVVQEDGSFQRQIALEAGWNHLLLVGTDQAGNNTKTAYSVFRDTQEPELSWQTRPDEVFDKKSARLVLDLKDDGSISGVSGKIDGEHPVTWFAKGDGRWVGTTPELHEGFHSVTVKAADGTGRVVSSERQFVINASEALGEAVIGLGARGADVKLLHERLVEAGYLTQGTVGTVFNKNTEEALKKLQAAEGFDVTGKAEGETLIALGPRIFINLSKFSLVLDRPGKEQRRWQVATGSWAHPTPQGKFKIVEKVYHPTWLPPKSDWAKDAKPIPPGPGNPLGTRWLGFDWGGVGIHGTTAPWSIGTAASHGCLRMVTYQVEDLFELVEVGTPVLVLGGWEDNPALERYWPKKKPKPEKTAKTDKKGEADKKPAPLAQETPEEKPSQLPPKKDGANDKPQDLANLNG